MRKKKQAREDNQTKQVNSEKQKQHKRKKGQLKTLKLNKRVMKNKNNT